MDLHLIAQRERQRRDAEQKEHKMQAALPTSEEYITPNAPQVLFWCSKL